MVPTSVNPSGESATNPILVAARLRIADLVIHEDSQNQEADTPVPPSLQPSSRPAQRVGRRKRRKPSSDANHGGPLCAPERQVEAPPDDHSSDTDAESDGDDEEGAGEDEDDDEERSDDRRKGSRRSSLTSIAPLPAAATEEEGPDAPQQEAREEAHTSTEVGPVVRPPPTFVDAVLVTSEELLLSATAADEAWGPSGEIHMPTIELE